jgi:N-acetylglutamate synthase-like GNAT family acetyltransferase
MQEADEYYVSTCSHVNESDELDAHARQRLQWLKANYEKGLRVKVAFLDDNPIGCLYLIPIEICPWGPLGEDLMVLPCLWVVNKARNKGIGKALIDSAEQETKHQKRKALTVIGFYHDFWFMPASFFEKHGFSALQHRDEVAILWKVFDESAKPPKFLERNYKFKRVPNKVVVDLFWHSFCLTSIGEAQRVREVVAEFGDSVILKEYCGDDRDILLRYQIPRAIFLNGTEIGWGYQAPKESIREAISKALNL